MSAHRFFLENDMPDGRAVVLPLAAEDVHHATTVLRVRPGETIEVVEVSGAVWSVRVTAVGDRVEAERVERVSTGGGPAVTLVQGIAKGEKMDAIVRQAVEIGVASVVPVTTERSIVRLDAGKAAQRTTRWQRVAKAAAEQSHARRIPEVHEPTTLTQFAQRAGEYDAIVVLWEESAPGGLVAALEALRDAPGPRVAVVVGPEGGLSASEVELLRSAGARTVGLGDTILRTETAAIVGVALVVHHLGGLGAEARS